MISIDKILPVRDLVVIKVLGHAEVYNSLMTHSASTEDNIAIRYGKVISIGPEVDTELHCKGLKVNEIAIYTEFAGYHIPVKDELVKVIRGYDIIGKTTDMNDINALSPTGNRILIEKVDIQNDDDIITDSYSDPRLADLSYGKVLKISPGIAKLDLRKGQLVAFPPYAGTVVQYYESDGNKEMSIVVEGDILFTA